jgi:hypothetical protein
MSDEVSADRVAVIAAAARVPIEPDSCARVARAVTPTVTRFAAQGLTIGFEVEPSSFTVIARQETGK